LIGAISGIMSGLAAKILFPLEDEVSAGYVQPNKVELKVTDLDLDGNPESIARYNGTNYLFRVGTNGVPYFEPIKGLEIKVEK
jgi:hypothetical protein